MRLHIYISILFVFVISNSFGQKEITLQYCHSRAIEVSPLQKQKLLYTSLNELSDQSSREINLPMLMLNGQATYQSDVFRMPFEVPGIDSPLIPKNQYKVGIDFYQNIYNGGKAKNQQSINGSQDRINQQSIEISLYKVHEVINKLYFSVLLLQEQIQLLISTQEDLAAQKNLVDSKIKSGAALPGSSKSLLKEILSLDQLVIELDIRKNSNKDLLGAWMEEDITSSSLTLPVTAENTSDLNRPEISMFDYQIEAIQTKVGMIDSDRIPDVGVFGTAGIGYPNPLNWFSVKHDPYALVGIKFSWKILDYGKAKNDRESAKLNQQIVLAEKENFVKKLTISVSGLNAEAGKYKLLIEKDAEIISLQEEIIAESSAQLQNGIIPSANFIIEVNKGLQAKLNMKIHEIMLSESYINILTETGNIGEL